MATNFQSSLALPFSISSLVKAAMYLTLCIALFSSGHRSRALRLSGAEEAELGVEGAGLAGAGAWLCGGGMMWPR